MIPTLSPNAQAILLLTAPLIAGRAAPTVEPLSPGEYKRLARHLRESQSQPADLANPNASELIESCKAVIDGDRLQRLLGRGFLLGQVMERWRARAIWVVSRADADYPRRIKAHLREDAPPILYGCGDVALLQNGGLAVVGSRQVDDALVDYTTGVGRLAAEASRGLVSGGARGIDQAAMRGALEAGGKVVGVLGDSLEKAAMSRENRDALLAGRLVLVSPYDPSAGFNVGHAMQRNKLIYALADAALVVNSDVRKGGTWAGATEQLEKLRFVPVYVRSTGESSAGLEGLLQKGAVRWPNPRDAAELEGVFTRDASVTPSEPGGHALDARHDAAAQAMTEISAIAPLRSAAAEASTPADVLLAAVRGLLQGLLKAPMKDAQVAAALGVSTAQARMWLQRFVEEGVLERYDKGAAYLVRQAGLFDSPLNSREAS